MRGVRRWLAGDEGAVTAEFAIVLPTILLVVSAAIGALSIVTDAIRLADAAGVAARAAGRGDQALVQVAVERLVPGASFEVTRGDYVCVRISRAADLGPLAGAVALSANSCAAEAGA